MTIDEIKTYQIKPGTKIFVVKHGVYVRETVVLYATPETRFRPDFLHVCELGNVPLEDCYLTLYSARTTQRFFLKNVLDEIASAQQLACNEKNLEALSDMDCPF
jgi:hypothetical protein